MIFVDFLACIGSEVDVIPDLIRTGAMDKVHLAYIEWHPRWQRTEERRNSYWKALEMVKDYKGCLIRMDDESYGQSDFPLPSCD